MHQEVQTICEVFANNANNTSHVCRCECVEMQICKLFWFFATSMSFPNPLDPQKLSLKLFVTTWKTKIFALRPSCIAFFNVSKSNWGCMCSLGFLMRWRRLVSTRGRVKSGWEVQWMKKKWNSATRSESDHVFASALGPCRLSLNWIFRESVPGWENKFLSEGVLILNVFVWFMAWHHKMPSQNKITSFTKTEFVFAISSSEWRVKSRWRLPVSNSRVFSKTKM